MKGKQPPQKGKGYGVERKGMKGKEKAPNKVKGKFNAATESGKGKGNSSKFMPTNVDNAEKLSPTVQVFHETISEVPLPDNGIWKNEVFKHWKITENARHRKYVLDNCFQHLSDILGKDKNIRLYIGPGRDGSSEDKISVDCKFESRTTKVEHVSKALKSQEYVKTSFIFDNDEWRVVEDQVDLETDTPFTQKVSRMAIIIHPMFSTADEDAHADAKSGAATADTGSGAATANLAIDPEIDFKADDSPSPWAVQSQDNI